MYSLHDYRREHAVMDITVRVDTDILVQILDEALCISFAIDPLGKDNAMSTE